MVRLETTTWVSAYREMFKGLSEKALAAQAQDAAWLAENAPRVGLGGALPATSGPEGDETDGEGDDGGEDETGDAPDPPGEKS